MTDWDGIFPESGIYLENFRNGSKHFLRYHTYKVLCLKRKLSFTAQYNKPKVELKEKKKTVSCSFHSRFVFQFPSDVVCYNSANFFRVLKISIPVNE